MRTRWLIASGDGLLSEHVHTQGSLKGVHRLAFWSYTKDRLGAINVSCMAFGEPEVFRTAQKNVLQKFTETRSGNIFSRRSASPGGDFTALDTSEEWNEVDEYDQELTHYRGLVLDVSYRPINIVCWRRALCLEILEKADVLEYYDQVINSPGRTYPIPAVLRITDYVHTPKLARIKLSLSRKNIFLRDKFRCQYCNTRENLTLDHVVPISRGGEWSWQNLVTACSKCNARKGDKTLEEAKMELIKVPKEPKPLDGRDMPSNYAAYRTLNSSKRMPTEWTDYLPKHSSAP